MKELVTVEDGGGARGRHWNRVEGVRMQRYLTVRFAVASAGVCGCPGEGERVCVLVKRKLE